MCSSPWAVAALALVLAPSQGGVRVVGRAEIAEAMRHSQGFDLTATANGARLHAEVFLRLVREARDRDPDGPALFFDHADWFHAFLDRTGLPPEKAPTYVRLAYQHREDTTVEHRADRVLAAVIEGPRPVLAANVRTSWPRARGTPTSYSYEDLLSSPQLRVTVERVLTYRLLDYGGMIVFDEVEGLRGRPTSGALGMLFDLIGEASILETRMAVSSDGLLISRGHGRKGPFSASATVTIQPSGRAERDLPPGRPDLAALAERLKQRLKLRYVPLPPEPAVGP